MAKVVVDIEVYRNYFLCMFKSIETGNVKQFEIFNDSKVEDITTYRQIFRNHTIITFNGNGYDLPLIEAALNGYTNSQLKDFSDEIIKSNLPNWKIVKQKKLNIHKTWNHIDLIEVAPGISSLKIYGGRLHAPTMQDLPYNEKDLIDDEKRLKLIKYCENDLDTTALLFNALQGQISLREQMSEEYGMDLRSSSDAQIAETVIKSELTKITGEQYFKPDVENGRTYPYHDPDFISFKNEMLQQTFEKILKTKFELGGNGSIQIPSWLKDNKITIGDAEYQMGIGGLHSCEKRQYITSTKTHKLYDYDVASYYPSIILQQRLAPESMGEDFLTVYQSIVTRRLEAKKSGNKVVADSLKIAVNGSFGKLGSKYSPLYSPQLLIQVTITGQLALLMLIERMESIGIKIMSANTDGIVLNCPIEKERAMEEVAWEWMLETSYELERNEYAALASRDVNNYIAVTTGGKCKRKGVFAEPTLSKNPDMQIIYEAVSEYIAKGTPVKTTINNCKDVRQFVSIRKVKGGAVWRDEFLGKAVRFYYSSQVPESEAIHYALNGNRVPKSNGAKPLMVLPDTFPDDVETDYYIKLAEDLLCEVGINA